MSDDASAGTRDERCGHPTDDSGDCDLPASRADGHCHLHTDVVRSAGDETTAADGREMIIETLEEILASESEKLKNGRIRDTEKEKVKIKRARGIAYVANVLRQVKNDRDLEELTERIEQLEERADGDVVGPGGVPS